MTDISDNFQPSENKSQNRFSLFMCNLEKYCVFNSIFIKDVLNASQEHHKQALDKFYSNTINYAIAKIPESASPFSHAIRDAFNTNDDLFNPDEIFFESTKFNIVCDITRKDFCSIAENSLAKSQVMNCFGHLLQIKADKSESRVFIAHTLFFSYLYQTDKFYSFNKTARGYIEGFDVQKHDTILIPHFIDNQLPGGVGGHWALITVCMNEKIIYNMDSLNTKDGVLERMYSVLCWLFDSMIEEEGEFLHVDQWYFQTKAIFDKQQENGVDCGFYVLHYMKFIIEGKGLKSLTDLHMVEFRKFVGLALLKKSIWWERNKEKYGVADNDV